MTTGSWLHLLDETGLTPFNRVTGSNHMALTEFILRREAEDRSLSLDGSSPLHKAAYLGLKEAVQSLLAGGADVNARDKHGEGPLHKAARQGHLPILEVLLEHDADCNAADDLGLTPLHWVALNGKAPLAEFLVLNGGNPRLPSEYLDSLTPLNLARIMNYGEVIKAFETLSQ